MSATVGPYALCRSPVCPDARIPPGYGYGAARLVSAGFATFGSEAKR